jgi:hypothetical protein
MQEMINMTPEREIRAVYNDETIRVYQAYNAAIAAEAVRLGTFGSQFSMNRMTWIKPSFLWMMYRCGWAEKENQEHVLAIDLKRSGFDYAVQHAVQSSYYPESGIPREEWQAAVSGGKVTITGYTGKTGADAALQIPETMSSYPVTDIGPAVFKGKKFFSVSFPSWS